MHVITMHMIKGGVGRNRIALAPALALLAAAVAAPLAALAQDALVPLPAPEARPYPYAVLDVQPGMLAAEARAVIEAELGAELEPQRRQVRVQARDGAAFEFTYDGEMSVPNQSSGIGRPQEPFETVVMVLATDVLEGRVVKLWRKLHQPNAELPEPAALRAQLEGLYGPPSEVETQYDTTRLTWAWGEDGFIEDLAAVEAATMEHEVEPGEVREVSYWPCKSLTEADFAYSFSQLRHEPFNPGCVATYTVTYERGPETSTVTFALADHALGRAQREETDRQITEALTATPAAPAEPSDMKL